MNTKPFLTTTWSHLAMLNYEIDPAVMRPLLPQGTELDDFDGRHFVSMVGFLYSGTRVLGLAIPRHQSFAEVNLRYYVRRRTSEGWRRGVAFIKEIVPRRAVAIVARVLYDENFVACPMRYSITNGADTLPTHVEYAWYCGSGWHQLRLETADAPRIPTAGSEEEFITEHYWGYTARRDGSTSEYRVEHPQWRVAPATTSEFTCNVAGMYGPEFVDALSSRPSSAFLAEGSPVVVYRGRQVSHSYVHR